MLHYTKEQLVALHEQRLDELIDAAGSVNHLSKMLGLPYHTVRSWHDRGRISKLGARGVERHPVLGEKGKGFTRKYLRPDAWS